MDSVRCCVQCGNPIAQKRGLRAIYCSSTCASRAQALRCGNRVADVVTKNTRGAINELVVCTDLMERGFQVFRAMSPHCPCDLIAVRNGTMTRVEVKTGQYTINHVPSVPALRVGAQREWCDVLAVVMTDGVIFYRPEIDP